MLIAEDLFKGGISIGDKFNTKITEFVKEKSFKKLIETGTCFGTGSTRAILDGLTGEFDFYSIEADPERYEIAKKNLKGVKGIHLINGLSVAKSQIPVSLSEDFPEFVVIDHQPKNRLQLYIQEVNHNVSDHALDAALKAFDYMPDFVLLDSAGYMGFIEFKYLLERVKAPFYLALDDTDHIKHYESMMYIRANPDRFEIIWEVRGQTVTAIESHNIDKFGSAIIRVS